jgi:hypothetical protein
VFQRTHEVRLIDVGMSDDYVDSHIPDARWCSRIALGRLLQWEETLLDDIEQGGMVPYHNLLWR